MIEEEPLNGFTGFARKNHAQFQYSRDMEVAQAGAEIAFDESLLASIAQTDRRWAWVEVNLEAITHNVLEARRRLQPGVQLMAVVKADGYGHGAVECAQTALQAGADQLGVATVDEAIRLREAGLSAPILLLSEPPASAIPLLLAHHITPSVYTIEFTLAYAEEADRHNMKAPFHLALNTGMNRIGVRAEEALDFVRQISFHRALVQLGTFTHFATADSSDAIDFNSQVRRFINAISSLRNAGVDTGMVHAANSAALFRFSDVHFDMVRLGISMYGYHACEQTRGAVDLWPAMEVKARITDVKTVPMSEGVSYGLHYRSPGSVKICTVPLGYADGLSRALSGKWDFILGGQFVRQVGTICMDQCMFEVD
ncbi:MAG: alanine racemase, partial [Eggerthellaceae bacterium]|nr:alanine racemase [Eggerthellaceae bacterium]